MLKRIKVNPHMPTLHLIACLGILPVCLQTSRKVANGLNPQPPLQLVFCFLGFLSLVITSIQYFTAAHYPV